MREFSIHSIIYC